MPPLAMLGVGLAGSIGGALIGSHGAHEAADAQSQEGHFDAVGIFAAQANLMDEIDCQICRRRRVQEQMGSRQQFSWKRELMAFAANTDTAFPEFFRNKV